MDAATVEILLKAKQEGLDAIKDLKDAIADLRNQAVIANQQLSFIGAAAFTSSLALNALQDATRASGVASTAAAGSASAGGGGFLGLSTAMLVMIAVVAALLVALSPFIVLVAGAVTILTAFAAGVVAVSTALLLAFGPLVALTAGVVLLADRMFTTGKTAVDPLLQIEQALGKVADAWGRQATPMANQFLAALLPMVPMIQAIGTQALIWFGQQMPLILQIMTFTAKALFDAFELGGRIFAAFFTAMAANRATFEQFFSALLTVGLQAVQGLLTNLLALSDWFLQRLPAMAPIVAQIMGGIGTVIQGVARVAGEVVDWFIKNWPEITKVASKEAALIGEAWQRVAAAAAWMWQQILIGWNMVAPVLRAELPLAIQIVAALWDYLREHTSLVRALLAGLALTLIALGIVLGAAAVLIVAVGVAAVGALAGLQFLYDKFNALLGMVDAVTRAVWGLLDAIGRTSAAAQALRGIGGAVAGAAGGGGSGGDLTAMATGGYVPGPIGAPRLIVAHGGEYVIPADGMPAPGRAASGSLSLTSNIALILDGQVIAQVIDRRIDQRLAALMTGA